MLKFNLLVVMNIKIHFNQEICFEGESIMKLKKVFFSVISCCILCSCSANSETTDDHFQDAAAKINSLYKETDINNINDLSDKNDFGIETEISKAEAVDQTPSPYAYDEQEKCLTIDLKNISGTSEMPDNSEMAEILKIDDLTDSSLDISSLGKLENIRQIYINGTINDFRFTENYKNLTDVYIEHFDGELSGLYENSSVKKVSIADSQIEIECIDKWNELEELDISSSDVIISGNYNGFGKLKRFNAVCSCFEHNDLSFAENAPELTEFVYSPLKNVELLNYTKLAFCDELKVLTLSGNITNLNFLTELKELESLTVITENYLELASLYEHNSLNTVAISCTGYDNEEKMALIEKSPQCNWTIMGYDKIF